MSVYEFACMHVYIRLFAGSGCPVVTLCSLQDGKIRLLTKLCVWVVSDESDTQEWHSACTLFTVCVCVCVHA